MRFSLSLFSLCLLCFPLIFERVRADRFVSIFSTHLGVSNLYGIVKHLYPFSWFIPSPAQVSAIDRTQVSPFSFFVFCRRVDPEERLPAGELLLFIYLSSFLLLFYSIFPISGALGGCGSARIWQDGVEQMMTQRFLGRAGARCEKKGNEKAVWAIERGGESDRRSSFEKHSGGIARVLSYSRNLPRK